MKNILVACEESQAVCSAFRKLGYNAYSCDLKECSGGHPEWHIQGDALATMDANEGVLQNGEPWKLEGNWDLLICHPTCTFLSVSGAKWYYHPDDKDLPVEQRRPHPKFPTRAQDREEAIEFFMKFANSKIPHIAIENPVGIMSSRWRKPDQIVQPYMFGDEARKTTCLWLKGLPSLIPTKVVSQGESVVYSSGKRMPKWYADALTNAKDSEERRTIRSKTFQGIADAMAEQWGAYINGKYNDVVNKYTTSAPIEGDIFEDIKK